MILLRRRVFTMTVVMSFVFICKLDTIYYIPYTTYAICSLQSKGGRTEEYYTHLQFNRNIISACICRLTFNVRVSLHSKVRS